MRWLNETIEFPPLSEANSDGLLAVGGDLSSKRVLHAYKNGIFPWYETDQPLLWWSPDPRFVLYPNKLKVSKSSNQLLRSKKFEVSINRNFEDVIQACAKIKTQVSRELNKGDSGLSLQGLGEGQTVEIKKKSTTDTDTVEGELVEKAPTPESLVNPATLSITHEQAWDFVEKYYTLDDVQALLGAVKSRIKSEETETVKVA